MKHTCDQVTPNLDMEELVKAFDVHIKNCHRHPLAQLLNDRYQDLGVVADSVPAGWHAHHVDLGVLKHMLEIDP